MRRSGTSAPRSPASSSRCPAARRTSSRTSSSWLSTPGPPSLLSRLGARATWTVELAPTKDIAQVLGEQKRSGQVLVAFGAEHGDAGLERKRAMLETKHADLVVFNDIGRPGVGFDGPENEVVLISRESDRAVPRARKETVAAAILDAVQELL